MISRKKQQIETALNQLSQTNATESETQPTSEGNQPDEMAGDSKSPKQRREPSFSMAVQPFPARQQNGKTPMLPKLKSPSISEHRHAVNPALAMNLLQDIEAIVGGWQQELQTILRQIQDLYLEGPIVDGWLDSHETRSQSPQASVRQATADRLMDYIEQELNQSDAKVTYQTPRTGYRLCGLDADGKTWSRPCPPEQVPSVSLAIARHQKLRQLLSRKQYLETRLSQLAETLVVMHSHLSRE